LVCLVFLLLVLLSFQNALESILVAYVLSQF
jgi:hypothetical protein